MSICVRFLVAVSCLVFCSVFLFFFNDTATTEIYTLSYTTLFRSHRCAGPRRHHPADRRRALVRRRDRKSTRLNSSHVEISYAVFCLKKKNLQHDASGRVRRDTCDWQAADSRGDRYLPLRGWQAGRDLASVGRPRHDAAFFFNDTATTEIYTLSLHDALPI